MRESDLIASVHKHLPPPAALHRQSMTFSSLSFNGTPDRYYDGPNGDLWIEYKRITSWPRSGRVGGVDEKKPGCYRPNQFEWMERRWENGRNVYGAIFLPDKRVVLQSTPDEWKHGSPFKGNEIDRRTLAAFIRTQCLGVAHE